MARMLSSACAVADESGRFPLRVWPVLYLIHDRFQEQDADVQSYRSVGAMQDLALPWLAGLCCTPMPHPTMPLEHDDLALHMGCP